MAGSRVKADLRHPAATCSCARPAGCLTTLYGLDAVSVSMTFVRNDSLGRWMKCSLPIVPLNPRRSSASWNTTSFSLQSQPPGTLRQQGERNENQSIYLDRVAGGDCY